jgi:hydroxyacylglutathione hydrolase
LQEDNAKMTVIADDKNIRVEMLTLGPYETNAYTVVCNKSGESLVVDAPANAPAIIASLTGTKPKYILLTHDHYDHTGVIVSLRKRLKVPLATHIENSYELKTPPDIFINDGDTLKLGNLTIEAIYTPGHTPGSTCFKVGNFLFAGDTIFPGGPGHTETPEEFRQILSSIKQKILTLPDETLVLPGHGDGTTVKKAKAEYTIFTGKKHSAEICGDVTWRG